MSRGLFLFAFVHAIQAISDTDVGYRTIDCKPQTLVPNEEMRYFKNGDEFQPEVGGNRTSINSNRIVIYPVELSDEGIYICFQRTEEISTVLFQVEPVVTQNEDRDAYIDNSLSFPCGVALGPLTQSLGYSVYWNRTIYYLDGAQSISPIFSPPIQIRHNLPRQVSSDDGLHTFITTNFSLLISNFSDLMPHRIDYIDYSCKVILLGFTPKTSQTRLNLKFARSLGNVSVEHLNSTFPCHAETRASDMLELAINLPEDFPSLIGTQSVDANTTLWLNLTTIQDGVPSSEQGTVSRLVNVSLTSANLQNGDPRKIFLDPQKDLPSDVLNATARGQRYRLQAKLSINGVENEDYSDFCNNERNVYPPLCESYIGQINDMAIYISSTSRCPTLTKDTIISKLKSAIEALGVCADIKATNYICTDLQEGSNLTLKMTIASYEDKQVRNFLQNPSNLIIGSGFEVMAIEIPLETDITGSTGGSVAVTVFTIIVILVAIIVLVIIEAKMRRKRKKMREAVHIYDEIEIIPDPLLGPVKMSQNIAYQQATREPNCSSIEDALSMQNQVDCATQSRETENIDIAQSHCDNRPSVDTSLRLNHNSTPAVSDDVAVELPFSPHDVPTPAIQLEDQNPGEENVDENNNNDYDTIQPYERVQCDKEMQAILAVVRQAENNSKNIEIGNTSVEENDDYDTIQPYERVQCDKEVQAILAVVRQAEKEKENNDYDTIQPYELIQSYETVWGTDFDPAQIDQTRPNHSNSHNESGSDQGCISSVGQETVGPSHSLDVALNMNTSIHLGDHNPGESSESKHDKIEPYETVQCDRELQIILAVVRQLAEKNSAVNADGDGDYEQIQPYELIQSYETVWGTDFDPAQIDRIRQKGSNSQTEGNQSHVLTTEQEAGAAHVTLSVDTSIQSEERNSGEQNTNDEYHEPYERVKSDRELFTAARQADDNVEENIRKVHDTIQSYDLIQNYETVCQGTDCDPEENDQTMIETHPRDLTSEVLDDIF